MDKNDLLKQIADAAYNVGYGAKKHFATYEIIEKAPGWIIFITLAVGILALFIEALTAKSLSAALIILGISSLYIEYYKKDSGKYDSVGKELTKLFNELKIMYFSVKSSSQEQFAQEIARLKSIENELSTHGISKQIFLSDWYAHYKFFWQHQIEWIDEQKHFKFWRDKVPLSLTITLIFCLLGLACIYFPCAQKMYELVKSW